MQLLQWDSGRDWRVNHPLQVVSSFDSGTKGKSTISAGSPYARSHAKNKLSSEENPEKVEGPPPLSWSRRCTGNEEPTLGLWETARQPGLDLCRTPSCHAWRLNWPHSSIDAIANRQQQSLGDMLFFLIPQLCQITIIIHSLKVSNVWHCYRNPVFLWN